jgi:hypothetical protein
LYAITVSSSVAFFEFIERDQAFCLPSQARQSIRPARSMQSDSPRKTAAYGNEAAPKSHQKNHGRARARPCCCVDFGGPDRRLLDYLFSTLPGFEGRKPPIGVGDGNGAGRGAPKVGAGVGDGTGRGATGCVGHGVTGAAAGIGGDAGFASGGDTGRGAGAVNGAIGTGFGAGAALTAGFAAIVFAFTLACLLTFLAVFFAAVCFFAAALPFFLRNKMTRFVFFAFFECFALLLDLLFDVLAMIAS